MQIRIYWISIFKFKDVPGSHGLWSIYSVIHALMWTFFFVILISMIEFQMRWSPGANPANTNFQIVCFTLYLPFILSFIFLFFFRKVLFTYLVNWTLKNDLNGRYFHLSFICDDLLRQHVLRYKNRVFNTVGHSLET